MINSELDNTHQTTDQISSIPTIDGVGFDAEKLSLRGLYSDEISTYRARKLWIETLQSSFLLEEGSDFELSVSKDATSNKYLLLCEFKSACARYAFWRITNNQAPDAQYIIETAHIPVCNSRQDEILHAPDLKSVNNEPYRPSNRARRNTTIPEILKMLVEKIRGEKAKY